MRLWHSAAATSARFDDPNLVSHVGLVPVMRLAQECGLAGITPSFPQIDQRVCDPGGSTAEDPSRETKLPAF